MSNEAKTSRNQQWKDNSINRRKRIVAEGGRVLPLLLEKEYSDRLDKLIELRRKADPTITMTGLIRKMIDADFKLLLRRRKSTVRARSSAQ